MREEEEAVEEEEEAAEDVVGVKVRLKCGAGVLMSCLGGSAVDNMAAHVFCFVCADTIDTYDTRRVYCDCLAIRTGDYPSREHKSR